MRGQISVTLDYETLVAVDKVMKDMRAKQSQTVEYLIRLGLEKYEASNVADVIR